jgi:hypothetical protein
LGLILAYLIGGAIVLVACWSIVDLAIGFFNSRGQ